jgi:hypothetical protein
LIHSIQLRAMFGLGRSRKALQRAKCTVTCTAAAVRRYLLMAAFFNATAVLLLSSIAFHTQVAVQLSI